MQLVLSLAARRIAYPIADYASVDCSTRLGVNVGIRLPLTLIGGCV